MSVLGLNMLPHISQVGSLHYLECQVFRTLKPRLQVTDFKEEGNVIYQVLMDMLLQLTS